MTLRQLRTSTSICFVLLAMASSARALQTDLLDTKQGSTQKDQLQNQYQQNLQNLKLAVMDGPVDPKEYIVGPGDIYNVSMWINPPLSLQIPVTPEGSLIIPTVGEIFVGGMHLDQAKKKVIAEVRKKYIAGEVSLTLFTPRMLAVTVKGIVRHEGTVYVQATERVDQAITLANSLDTRTSIKDEMPGPKYGYPGELIVKPDTIGSSRRIIVRHRDGSRATADLEKFFVRRQSSLNPLLQDGDVIIVPKRNLARDFIGVYGAVNGEGDYEYVEGDSLVPVLRMARGLTALAESSRVEITRFDEQEKFLETDTLDLSAIVAGRAPDYAMRRGDRIVIKERPEALRDYKVYIGGEVMFPGYYPVSRDSTMLSEIVRRAGGFRESALLSSSQLFRRPRPMTDIAKYENRIGESDQEDSLYYLNESYLRMNGELVVVDFVGLFGNNNRSKDVTLRDGDHIIIGKRTNTVFVFGQVVQPGHVPFAKNQGYKYYVERAGGLSENAVKGDIRIIKASTRQWLEPGETTIEEGDCVWVPKEPYRSFSYNVQIYTQFFSILATLATLTVLVVQLKK